MPRRRKSSKKLYIAISLIIVLVVASAAIIYAANTYLVPRVTVGVKVGDTFTYSLMGVSQLTGLDATTPAGFDRYNNTDYYKVSVTAINGTKVSLATEWRFLNGSSIDDTQTINLANGEETDQTDGFWAIYASGLKVNDYVRPQLHSGLIVNSSDTQTFTSGTRNRNFWSIENQFVNTLDPTGSTQSYNIIRVYFDRQTGMLISLANIEEYNNPEMTLYTTWQLTNCSEWQVA